MVWFGFYQFGFSVESCFSHFFSACMCTFYLCFVICSGWQFLSWFIHTPNLLFTATSSICPVTHICHSTVIISAAFTHLINFPCIYCTLVDKSSYFLVFLYCLFHFVFIYQSTLELNLLPFCVYKINHQT